MHLNTCIAYCKRNLGNLLGNPCCKRFTGAKYWKECLLATCPVWLRCWHGVFVNYSFKQRSLSLCLTSYIHIWWLVVEEFHNTDDRSCYQDKILPKGLLDSLDPSRHYQVLQTHATHTMSAPLLHADYSRLWWSYWRCILALYGVSTAIISHFYKHTNSHWDETRDISHLTMLLLP